MRSLLALKELILNALFPPVCVSCKKEGDFLCADCLASLAKKKIRPYSKTQKKSEFNSMDGVIYALDYAKNPQIQAAIKQFKYRFTEELAAPFAELIAEKIKELGMVKGKRLILIPVPLHLKRLRERGFNQADVIAQSIVAQCSNQSCEVLDILARQKETSQQAKLSKTERQNNLEGAFEIRKEFLPLCHSERSRGMNKKVIHKTKPENLYFLVDDVCTTGSTLENCAKVLKENGIEKVYGLVIARAFK